RRLNIGIGLLHRPQLLILDEPTVGVDPQSRNAILESVEHLSTEGMAVLYTTHYMEEAERLCDRIGIIDHGQLMAEGSRRELVASIGEQDRIHITCTGRTDQALDAFAAIDGVSDATADESGVTLLTSDAARAVARAVEVADSHALSVPSVEITQPDLEAVFLHLTGRALRDRPTGAALLIAAQHLRPRARDRSLFILAFGAPLALAFVFSIVFGGLDDGERIQFSFGLVDDDGGDLAVAFTGVLDSLVDEGLVELSRYDTADEAREA